MPAPDVESLSLTVMGAVHTNTTAGGRKQYGRGDHGPTNREAKLAVELPNGAGSSYGGRLRRHRRRSHAGNVRQPNPGKCPKCGMTLIQEGARFGLLRHMLSNPRHLLIMAAIMVALMAAAMMLMR